MAMLAARSIIDSDTEKSYTGMLRYDAELNLNNRSLNNIFNIHYPDKDTIILQHKYTWDEFFSNDIIQNSVISEGFEWRYYIEEI